MSKVWFVTGTSTGFGRNIVDELIKTDARVVATARNTRSLADLASHPKEKILILPLDVTNNEQRKKAVSDALTHFGRIDILVNNAGYGLVGALEECREEDIRQQFETNFFGLAFLTQEILPIMRAQKGGHIINMSSIAGYDAGAGFSVYNASKFAVEGMSEALALEAAHLGIRVSLIEPGPFRINFASTSLKQARIIDAYDSTSGEKRRMLSAVDKINLGDPQRAARAVLEIAKASNRTLRYPFGKIAIERMKSKLVKVRAEIDANESLGLGTDFPQ